LIPGRGAGQNVKRARDYLAVGATTSLEPWRAIKAERLARNSARDFSEMPKKYDQQGDLSENYGFFSDIFYDLTLFTF